MKSNFDLPFDINMILIGFREMDAAIGTISVGIMRNWRVLSTYEMGIWTNQRNLEIVRIFPYMTFMQNNWFNIFK